MKKKIAFVLTFLSYVCIKAANWFDEDATDGFISRVGEIVGDE